MCGRIDFACPSVLGLLNIDVNHHLITETVTQRKQRERKMKQLLKLSAAPITALSALAFVAMATPVSAGEY